MKKLFVFLLAVAGLSFAPAFAQTLTGTIGSGANASYLVIEAGDFGAPLTFEYLYDYNPADPFDTYAMMTAIDAAVADLSFSYINYGTLDEPNYILDAVTYQSVTLTNTAWPAVGPFWTQWVSGGLAGYPTAEPVSSGSWGFGSGISEPYRQVEPGSWDGFIFNEGGSAPSVAPIPEPSAAFLAIFAAAALAFRIRRDVGTLSSGCSEGVNPKA